MPRGLDKIEQYAKAAQERSDAYERGEGFQRALVLKPGQTARGRFCEEANGVWALYFHTTAPKQGQKYGDKVLCLDQAFSESEEATYVEGTKECPACQLEGVNRSLRTVINFIRYDEPKLVRDKDNKPVKNQDGSYRTEGVEAALVVCSFGAAVGGRISYLESQHGPISKHVCTIARTNDNKNPFMIDIADKDKVPPEPFEIKLFEKKLDPPKAITSLSPRYLSMPLMSPGDMRRAFSGVSVPSGFQGGDDTPPAPTGNIYADAAAGGHIKPGAFSS